MWKYYYASKQLILKLSVIKVFEWPRERVIFQKTSLRKLFNQGFHASNLASMMHVHNSLSR